MEKIKIVRNNNFVTYSSHSPRNRNLSLQAKGLLSVIMDLPDNYELKKTNLHTFSKNGRDATIAAFDELIENGYVVFQQEKSENGRFVNIEYAISDSPFTENPFTGNPFTENPFTENQESYINKHPTSNIDINKKTNKKEEKIGFDLDGLFDEEPKEKISPQPPDKKEEMFDVWWKLYPKKTSKEKCKSKFLKFTLNDCNICIEHTKKYAEVLTDAKFACDPNKYLSNKFFKEGQEWIDARDFRSSKSPYHVKENYTLNNQVI